MSKTGVTHVIGEYIKPNWKVVRLEQTLPGITQIIWVDTAASRSSDNFDDINKKKRTMNMPGSFFGGLFENRQVGKHNFRLNA